MKKTYSKEERAEYFASLRARWTANKEKATADTDTAKVWEAINAEGGHKGSYFGFYWCYMSMKAQGLDGLPFVDCKTFNGWREAGFIVKKGEHAKIDGITWIMSDAKKDDEDTSMYPKMYKLFHKSQVEAIK